MRNYELSLNILYFAKIIHATCLVNKEELNMLIAYSINYVKSDSIFAVMFKICNLNI